MKRIFIFCLFAGLLFQISCTSEENIEFIREENQITVQKGDRVITHYLFRSKASKPILYPLYSPSGETLTRSFPLEMIEGESREHPHHTGVYFTYGSGGEVNGNSFWHNPHDIPPLTTGPKFPQIRHEEFVEINEAEGILSTLSYWMDKNKKPLLKEEREMKFQAFAEETKIDFTIYLTALDTSVTFEDTKEGMFAIRVADWLAEESQGTLYDGTGEYLNAEGDRNEENVWGKRSSWVRLQGAKEGKTTGIAIFHHPSSLNYPAYWHARGYGCFAANPIGQYKYQQQRKNGPENPQKRTFTLEPGDKALFKFRMIVYEGERGKAWFDKEFKNFSKN